LGLVMSQAMVISGADVAIVDLNSTAGFPPMQMSSTNPDQRKRHRSKQSNWWQLSSKRTPEQTSTCT
jgi:hypothetical protein